MDNKGLIASIILSLFASVVMAQGSLILAKRTATITVDTSADNYIYTVVADTNWYEVNCQVTIPGYTIDGSDTLTIDYGEEGTTVLLRLKHGTDFSYSIRAPGGDERTATLASANDISLTLGVHKYSVTGTTTIKTIESTGVPVGYEAVLMFSTSLTVDDDSGLGTGSKKDIKLAGGDFSATADDVLCLLFNGSHWVEKSRSNN